LTSGDNTGDGCGGGGRRSRRSCFKPANSLAVFASRRRRVASVRSNLQKWREKEMEIMREGKEEEGRHEKEEQA
jgi:hypothetical protein